MGFKETYFSIWETAWGMHKRYFGIRATDEGTWEKLGRECEEIAKKYNNKSTKKFVENLLLSVVSELERSARHEKEAGTTEKTQP